MDNHLDGGRGITWKTKVVCQLL